MNNQKILPIVFLAVLLWCHASLHAQKPELPSLGNPETFFRVMGHKNMWSLHISGSEIRFVSPIKGESFELPYIKAIDSVGALVYKASDKKNKITAVIWPSKCTDSITETTYEYAVKASVKHKRSDPKNLTGCGNYFPDQRLSAVWILETLNGAQMSPGDFGKELPYIDLHIKERAFSGFGGCNRITGDLTISDASDLSFDNVIGTKMMCMGGNKESLFMKALQTSNLYDIKGNRLFLYKDGKIQLTFRKAVYK